MISRTYQERNTQNDFPEISAFFLSRFVIFLLIAFRVIEAFFVYFVQRLFALEFHGHKCSGIVFEDSLDTSRYFHPASLT